ncbi:hypothetical protein L1277_002641 [Okibacterium sp. HSC-33S16]|uniref:amidase domain-containing protein n=1 Tax=Okibacterium sp. HSC-33S16 TaxID=2910965 RepID=UPI0020A1C098|nr:amidase domain-containing protein [Okibacterium sp. HSC-33S16]MCP2032538.1 hypothetical protein [Okibacterium sp. HSC-33S16]
MPISRQPVSPRVRKRRIAVVAGLVAVGAVLAGCATAANSDSAVGDRPQPAASAAPVAVAVTAVEPATGSVSGGTTVTVSGSGLSKATAVTVGGVDATDVTVTDDNSLSFVAPAALNYTPAAADVVVLEKETPLGLPTSFTYAVETGIDAQMSYAMAHWSTYNEAEWGNLNPVGGDCANFVSQTLIQRGWTQSDAWHNTGAGAKWTPSWGYVPAMDDWFASSKGPDVERLSLDQRDQVKVGDVAMFDWNKNDTPDHVMIVSKVFTEGDKTVIQLVGHNKDFDYRDLDNTITVEHPGGNAWFWSIPA